MKQNLFLIVLLGVCMKSTVCAQCPIRIDEFDSYNGNYSEMVIHFTNVSQKKIEAVDFAVVYLDQTLESHNPHETFVWSGKAESGKRVTARWKRSLLYRDFLVYPWGRMDVKKLRYADDSIWENDGACQETQDARYLRHLAKQNK
jgi:hypothetical protein